MAYATYRAVSLASTNAASILAGPCFFYAYYISNNNDLNFRYVHIFDLAIAPVGMAGVIMTMGIPNASGANQEYSNGIEIFNGLAIAFSTSPSALSAVAVDEVIANIFYEV